PVGVCARLPRHRAVVDQRRLVAASVADVAVEQVEAHVEAAVREPPVERGATRVQRHLRLTLPLHAGGQLEPERLRIPLPAPVRLLVAAHADHLTPDGVPERATPRLRYARVPHAYVILTMSRYMKVSVDFTPSISRMRWTRSSRCRLSSQTTSTSRS